LKSLIKHEEVRRATLVATVVATAPVILACVSCAVVGEFDGVVALAAATPVALVGPFALVNLIYWIIEGFTQDKYKVTK
jgi:hypothetical protein